jgi:hypothetical protein
MLSKLMCGAVVASAAAGASAQTWDFTYTGFTFRGPDRQQFLPDATIKGSFSGTDRNGDGVLSANELTSFIVHSFWNNDTDYTRCAGNANVYSACSLDAFSFGPNNKLAFTVTWNGGDNGYGNGWYGGIVSGSLEAVHIVNSFDIYSVGWLWSDQTTLAISPDPVPEPPQAAMALAGLAGLLAMTVQRRSTC